MNQATNQKQLAQLLSNLAEEVDVPESKYNEAKNRYEAVGRWLNQEDSALAIYAPEIYPQGSFALGTVVRPIAGDDYDIDAVCLLQCDQGQISQQELKKTVGDRLKESKMYKKLLDPKV